MFTLDGPTLRRAMQDAFDASTLAKGRVYHQQRRVLACGVTPAPLGGWLVTAGVRGSQRAPYLVDVELSRSEDAELVIEGSCSCPMEFDCKHVVAALLRVAERPEEWFLPGTPADRQFQAELLPGIPVAPLTPAPRPLNPQVESWLRQIDRAATVGTAAAGPPVTANPPERLLYILHPESGRLRIELVVARQLKKGGYGSTRNYQFDHLLRGPLSRFVRAEDVQLARKIALAQPTHNLYEVFLEGEAGAEVLKDLVATERCHWRGSGRQHRPLSLGPARAAQPMWTVDARGQQRPGWRVEPPTTDILPVMPLWYVDEATGQCGLLETQLRAPVAAAWLSALSVAPEDVATVADQLSRHGETLSLPPPQRVEVVVVAKVKPVPCLRLYSAKLQKMRYGYSWGKTGEGDAEEIDFAAVEFDYAGARIPGSLRGDAVEHFADGKLRRVHRDWRTEERAGQMLSRTGLQSASFVIFDLDVGDHAGALTFDDQDEWLDFVTEEVPELQQQGWLVEFEDSFQYRFAQPESWYTDATPEDGGHDWFGIELGVLLEGQKINLLPVLLQLLQKDPHLLQAGELSQMSDEATIPVPLPDGRKVLFPAARARQMLGALLELLNPAALNSKGQLRVPKLRAVEFAGEADWRWLGNSELRELCARLKGFAGIKPVLPSANLRATLRPYQQDGLNWLQFLREYNLAGVLADDMGLGKTVQALAHLLVEKESGRMDRPSLVIAPTSLMTNWRQETERFAPDLRVLVLHGLERKQHFERIRDYDLIITSYPLLPRDQAILREQEFHYVILDEAQFIKNPKTQYAQVVCALKARHHLCLTGTPMENHLGELWSLFHFLLPGFLGDEIRFNSMFRRPIEKGRSDDRRKLLARRVAPFLLRRKKDEVARELPPKTEIVQNVELTGAQRDLYESVRLAMHERVKAEVDSKGLSRAHIIILDALLKLRQICCHPRLLKLPSAQNVHESAKLELLLDLLPEMIAEGRRVLLFSQFTSMLALIQPELANLRIPYVLLTGDTRDRATPVRQFQTAEVPLFLISLKAGGTGLNLTAADTVIHYDPWWNPAVENQATDRAHRIGQDKKVFVYKLMTVGTVEEKIGAMQARKRELVEGLLNEERPDNLKLTADDLNVLFAPLG